MYAYTILSTSAGTRVEPGIEYTRDPYHRLETRMGPDSYVWPYTVRLDGRKIVSVDDGYTYVFLVGFDRGSPLRGPLLWCYDGEYDQTKALFALSEGRAMEWTAYGKRHRARVGAGMTLETEEVSHGT